MKNIISLIFILFSTVFFTQNLLACNGDDGSIVSFTYIGGGQYQMVIDYNLASSNGCPSAVYAVKLELDGVNVVSATPTTITGPNGSATVNYPGNGVVQWGFWGDDTQTPIFNCNQTSQQNYTLTVIVDGIPNSAHIFGEFNTGGSVGSGSTRLQNKPRIYGCKEALSIPAISCDASWDKPSFCDGDVTLFDLESTVVSGTTTSWTGTGVSGNNFDPSVLAGGIKVVVTREVNDGGIACAQSYELQYEDFDNNLNPVYGNEFGVCDNVAVQMDGTVYGSSGTCDYVLRLHINGGVNEGWRYAYGAEIAYIIDGVVTDLGSGEAAFPRNTGSTSYDYGLTLGEGSSISIDFTVGAGPYIDDCAYELFDASGNLVLASGFNNNTLGLSSGFTGSGNPSDTGPYIVPASSCGSYTYSWSPASYLDDPNIANPTVSASLPSDQTYTLTITSDAGCTKDFTTTVVVAVSTLPTITTAPMQLCADAGSQSISVTTPNPSTGSWSASCGSCIDASGNFSPSGLPVGGYTVTYETPGACGGSDDLLIEVFGSGVTVVDPLNVCLGDIVNLDATLTLGGSYVMLDSTSVSPATSINEGTNAASWKTEDIVISGLTSATVSGGLTKVCLDITNVRAEDMDVRLYCPDGATYIELTTDNGGNGDDFTNTCFVKESAPDITSVVAGDAPFSGDYLPEGALSTLDGCATNGTWFLAFVDDDATGATGTLNSWSMVFQEGYAVSSTAWNQTSGTTETLSGTTTTNATFTSSSVGTSVYDITITDNAGCTESATVNVHATDCSCPAHAGSFN